ncbi:MAG: hypothetical protein QW484_01865 [Candidatus Pacearchaeota archaeon]
MKKILLILIGIFLLFSFSYAIAEDIWYIKIIDGVVLTIENQKTLVPLNIQIVPSQVGIVSAYIKNDEELKQYLNTAESGKHVAYLFVINTVFEQLLSSNKNLLKEKTYLNYSKRNILLENLYTQISNNLKKKSLSFQSQNTFIALETPEENNYKLEFKNIIANGESDFESFLLNSTEPTPFDLTENKENEKRTMNLSSRKIDFFIKNIPDEYRQQKNLQPFREIKRAFFEIKKNSLVTAEISSSELSDNVAYYLPQGIVIFPEEKEIKTNFYSQGTSHLQENLGQNEFKIRNERGYVVFIPKEVILNKRFSATIKNNKLESIYLAPKSSFYYKYKDNLNYIDAETNCKFFHFTQKSKIGTGIIFNDNWTLELISNPTTTLTEEMSFNYNGYKIILEKGIGTTHTQLFFYPIETEEDENKVKVAVINGTACAEDLYRPIGTKFKNCGTAYYYRTFEVRIYGAEKVIDLIEKAKRTLPEPIYPPIAQVDVARVLPSLGPQIIKGTTIPELCINHYRTYSCITFPKPITRPKFEYNGLTYDCIITPECDGKWCCHGGNNRRCCKATKTIGTGTWEIQYRKTHPYAETWVAPITGIAGFDIYYRSDGILSWAARYDENGLRTLPAFDNLIEKNEQIKNDWNEFKNWFSQSGVKGNMDIELKKVSKEWPSSYFPDLRLPQLIAGQLPSPSELPGYVGKMPNVEVIASREYGNTQQYTLNTPSLDKVIFSPLPAIPDTFQIYENDNPAPIANYWPYENKVSMTPESDRSDREIIESLIERLEKGYRNFERDVQNRIKEYLKRTTTSATIEKIKDKEYKITIGGKHFKIKIEDGNYNLYALKRKIGKIVFENNYFKIESNDASINNIAERNFFNEIKIMMNKNDFDDLRGSKTVQIR